MKPLIGETQKYICWVLGISWVYGLGALHLATINHQITTLVLQIIWAFLPIFLVKRKDLATPSILTHINI